MAIGDEDAALNGRVLVIGREGDVVDAVVTVIRARGVEAIGATVDETAIQALAARDVSLLVIGGGIERRSREILRRTARSCGAAIVETPLRGGNVEDYVEREIIRRFRAGSTKSE